MSTVPATTPPQQQAPIAAISGAAAFRQMATKIATTLLVDWVGKERAGEATGRIAAALSSSAASAKKPEDFYSCTPASIANCVAISALTGIMPGTGSTALAYLVPRSPRRGEQKQLGYMFSHRGLNALANRSGQTMIPIPISYTDAISVSPDGEVVVGDIDFDNPPTEFDQLRGVVVVVKRLETGVVVTRGWMPRVLIEKRRNDSDSYTYAQKNDWAKDSDPWHKWPVEMALKTAMHYAVARGWCVIDDASSVRALSSDVTIDVAPVRPQGNMIEGPKSLEQLTETLSRPAGAKDHVGEEGESIVETETDTQYPGGEIPEGSDEATETEATDEAEVDPLAGVMQALMGCKTQKAVTDKAQQVRNDFQLTTEQDMRLDSWVVDCQSKLKAK